MNNGIIVKGKARIERSQIVETALRLLNDVGVDGLTTRALAKALNIQHPSLYWHFASKQALLEAMADAIVEPVARNVDRHDDRNSILRSLAREFRKALLAYRDGARVFGGTFTIGTNVLRLSEISLQALLKSGITESDAVDASFNLFFYVMGFTVEEQAFHLQWPQAGEKEIADTFRQISPDEFPAITRCLEPMLANDFEQRFESGLQMYLHGLDVLSQKEVSEPI